MKAEEFAQDQYGVITRAQAKACGLSDSAINRRVGSGRWIRMWPGVFRIVGAPTTGRQRAKAATLWVPESAISHLVAGRLLRFNGIQPDGLDLAVPPKCGVRSDELRIHHVALSLSERREVDGIPCTSAARTLIDCAQLLDAETLETSFEQARRMGLTSTAAMEKLLTKGRPGAALMREVLSHARARPRESRLEVKLARLLRRSNLPEPAPQFQIGRYRVDYAWREQRTVCECDGFEWHGNRLQWKRDRRRVAAIEAAGWRIVHVTWDDVTLRPEETISRLGLALRTPGRFVAACG